MASDIKKITEKCSWQEVTKGTQIYGSSTSVHFNTGEWRTSTPIFHEDKCKQCLLCVPVCPDSSIPVKDGNRGEFDLEHCKGCGICVKVCPFDAISIREGQ